MDQSDTMKPPQPQPQTPTPTPAPPTRKGQIRQLLLGGVLPIAAYTLVEETMGIMWGLVAGMIIGVGEMSYEWITQRKVSAITGGATALIVGLGAVSLFTQEGIWFKLQPAIMEAVMAGVLFVSSALGKPFLVMMAEKQGAFGNMLPAIEPIMRKRFSGLNLRMGVFFALHTILAVVAALSWSTRAWALLKGVGFTASLVIYMLLEVLLIRRAIRRQFTQAQPGHGGDHG